jgi:DNA-directed RNA polymerase specialized sigma24 family protein
VTAEPSSQLLTLTEHWNGTAWTMAPSPTPETFDSELASAAETATNRCHAGHMPQSPDMSAHQETFQHLREVRAEALKHFRLAQQLAAERRDLIRGLIAEGFSQADIARELGVSRQAIQKMLAL